MNHSIDDIRKLIIEYNEERKRHNNILAKAFKVIANYGWYISEDMPLNMITLAVRNVFEGKEDAVNSYFIEFYTNKLEVNIDKLKKRHSKRSSLIEEAYMTHRNKFYHASTLLFLTISDGICNGELFKIKKSKSAIKRFLIENETPDSLSVFLEVLTETNAVDVYYPNKQHFKSELNRHGIVHGYDLHYGTEVNSLKALSLLVFVNDMVNRHKRES